MFRFRESPLNSPADGKIPDDGWAEAFLIGTIIYLGPTISAEVINFSYRATRFGTFEMLGPAPYNERKKIDIGLNNFGH